MDYDKLTDTLRQHGVSCVRAHGRYCSICDEAATALSTLQAENEKLRAELEQVKAERDAAMECIETVYAKILIKCKTDAVLTIEKWKNKERSDNEV